MSSSSDHDARQDKGRTPTVRPDSRGQPNKSVRPSLESSTNPDGSKAGHKSDLEGRTDTGIPIRDSLSYPQSYPAAERYFEEVRPAIIAALALALDEDPFADVVVLAVRDGDVSNVIAPARSIVVEQLLASDSPRLREVADQIARPPSAPAARWVVLVAPCVTATASVVLVDLRHPEALA